MLGSDYHAMNVAAANAENPNRFQFRKLDFKPDEAFVEDECVHVSDVTQAAIKECLPLGYSPVSIWCLLFGGGAGDEKMTPLMYNAETQMREVLKLKTIARGYNTDRLNGSNCRLGSMKIKNTLFENISILRINRIPIGKALVTAFDRMGVTHEGLHIIRVNGYW